MMLLYCSALLGTFSWLPLWLEVFMHYTAAQAGVLIMPRGIACLCIMMATPMLLKYVDARFWVVFACFLYGVGTYGMTHFDLQQGPGAIFWPNLLQGFATGFFFVPITSLAYQTVSGKDYDAASGMFNFSRSLGSSIGVAIFSTVMVQEAQRSWNSLSMNITASNPAFYAWVAANHLSLHSNVTYARIAQIISEQSNMIAFNDANYLFAILCLCMVPFVFFIKGKKGDVDMGAH
jgi:DHA2 family multidrug resistance protein